MCRHAPRNHTWVVLVTTVSNSTWLSVLWCMEAPTFPLFVPLVLTYHGNRRTVKTKAIHLVNGHVGRCLHVKLKDDAWRRIDYLTSLNIGKSMLLKFLKCRLQILCDDVCCLRVISYLYTPLLQFLKQTFKYKIWRNFQKNTIFPKINI